MSGRERKTEKNKLFYTLYHFLFRLSSSFEIRDSIHKRPQKLTLAVRENPAKPKRSVKKGEKKDLLGKRAIV